MWRWSRPWWCSGGMVEVVDQGEKPKGLGNFPSLGDLLDKLKDLSVIGQVRRVIGGGILRKIEKDRILIRFNGDSLSIVDWTWFHH